MIPEIKKIKTNKKKSKIIWKFFFLIFLINIILFNWNEVSWLFHYRVAPRGIQSIIFQEDRIVERYDKDNTIKINAIGISAPIIIPDGNTDVHIYNALKGGVAHFPGSPFPGEKGVSILLGHSSPPGWPKIDYEWVFTEVEELERGDEIKIYFNGYLFTYIMTEQIFLEVGEQVPHYYSNKKEIILLSCWPPGKNIKRIGIRAVLTK